MAATLKPGIRSNTPAIGFTPVVDTDPYTIVVKADRPFMTNLGIKANQRGSLLPYGGTYIVENSDSLGTAPTDGAEVYYYLDDLLLQVDSTSTGDLLHFGFVVPGSVVNLGSSFYRFEVCHLPNGTRITNE